MIDNLQEFLLELGKGFSYPTIGIILCADKDDTVVKYSVLSDKENLFTSKYKLYLPSEEELKAALIRERELLECQIEE